MINEEEAYGTDSDEFNSPCKNKEYDPMEEDDIGYPIKEDISHQASDAQIS